MIERSLEGSPAASCPYCGSHQFRQSEVTSFLDIPFLLIGRHPVRCRRCLLRFRVSSFQLRKASERPARQRPAPIRFIPQDFPQSSRKAEPVFEHNVLAGIEALETAWHDAVQPTCQIELEICAQLAQASWHLQQLRQAERQVLQEAVRNWAFNGERGLRLMEWRRSTEESVRTLLSQIQILRDGTRTANLARLPAPPVATLPAGQTSPASEAHPHAASDLMALATNLASRPVAANPAPNPVSNRVPNRIPGQANVSH